LEGEDVFENGELFNECIEVLVRFIVFDGFLILAIICIFG
jgi:hypothetical protein